jgi:hypothetical protein
MTHEQIQERYLRAGGGVCPVCQSSDITGDSIEVDGNGASQDVTCAECEAHWLDCYTLTGVLFIREPEKA